MLSVLWRSKWIIVVAAIVTSSFVAYDSYSKDTLYRAETVLIVSSLTPTNVFSNEDMLAASYAELAMTEAVRARARQYSGGTNGGSNQAYGDSGIAADTKTDSPFIRVSATNRVAEEAINDANSVAAALVGYIDDLQKQSLKSKRELLLEELSQIDEEQKKLLATEPVDHSRVDALASVRDSIIRQNEELNAGLIQSSLVVVDEAESAAPLPSHPLRNTLISFVLGALTGAIIGFFIDAVRKSLRWAG